MNSAKQERPGLWMDTLAPDLRYGLRALRKSPGFTAAAVITLAPGIGANTAIFTVVNAVLLKSLTFPDAARIVQFLYPNSLLNNITSIPEFIFYQRQTSVIRMALGADRSVIRRLVIWQGMRVTLVGVAMGIAAAFGLVRLIASFLFGVKPWDLEVFVSVPLTSRNPIQCRRCAQRKWEGEALFGASRIPLVADRLIPCRKRRVKRIRS